MTRFREEWKAYHSSQEVTLLLSGGGDSTALFHLLRLAEQPFRALHFVHDGQPAFAAASHDFCRRLCSEFEVRLQVETIKGKEFEGDLSWEAACRHLRYLSLQSKDGPFLTAHTADDQAETVIMRLLGGAGLAGLGGIYPQRADGVLRPLLGVVREELRVFLRQNDWDWIDDPTNRDGNRRAIVRSEVMPTLLQHEPSLYSILDRTSRRLREDEEFLRAAAHQATSKLAIPPGDSWELQGLQELPSPLLVRFLSSLRKALAGPGFRPRATLIEEAVRLIRRGTNESQVVFPGGWSIWVLGARVWVCPALPNEKWEVDPISPGEVFAGLRVSFVPQPGWEAWPLPEGASLRSRRPGDRYQGRAVKKILAATDQPPWVRNRWPLLVREGEVLAVFGRPTPAGVGGEPGLWIDFQPEQLRVQSKEK